MRKLIAMAITAALILALSAMPAMAQTEQEGLVNVGNVGVGANVCDVSILVEEDDAAQQQCTNEQNN